MSVEIRTSGNVASIRLLGDIDYSQQEQLGLAFEEVLGAKPKEIEIDLKDTTFIDSSVIRTFLKFRDKAQRNKSSLTIVNCHDRIREIFVIGGFDQVFHMD